MSNFDERGRAEITDGPLRAPEATSEDSIDVVFDLDDPEQAKMLEIHKAAFGEAYVEVVQLGDGKAVLKLSPGGARRLL